MDNALTQSRLALTMDHTLLHPAASEADLAKHCDQALEFGFATVAIMSAPVAYCAKRLDGSSVRVCAAISFPFGQTTTAVKVYEAQAAIGEGAGEIDFVVNLGLLKSGRVHELEQEIIEVIAACKGATTKVILETCYLDDGEKMAITEMAVSAGADFVKTSTGRGPKGATLPDVLLSPDWPKVASPSRPRGGSRRWARC